MALSQTLGLNNDPVLCIEGETISCRSSDGYVNLTQLCKAGCKLFKNWNANQSSKDFMDELSIVARKSATDLIAFQTGKGSEQATWGHPQIAINISQWISPRFSVKVSRWIYELASSGDVTLNKERPLNIIDNNWIQLCADKEQENNYLKQQLEEKEGEILSLTNELHHEREEKIDIQNIHNAILEKREYYKFKKGPAVYLWHSSGTNRHKIGKSTKDINNRLKSARTSVPDLHLDYIVYINQAELLESSVKYMFRNFLVEPNHEILNINTKEIITFIKNWLKTYKADYMEENNIWKYNGEYPPLPDSPIDNEQEPPIQITINMNMANVPSIEELKKIQSEMCKYLVKDLKSILDSLGLAKHGNKDKLKDRLNSFLEKYLDKTVNDNNIAEPDPKPNIIKEQPQDDKSHLRQCTVCKKIKLLSRFWNVATKKGGKDTVCSKCQNNIRREKYRKMTRE